MSNKKDIYLKINKDDIGSVILTLISRISKRNDRGRGKIYEKIGTELQKNSEDIEAQALVDLLSQITQLSSNEALEYEDMLPLIGALVEKSDSET